MAPQGVLSLKSGTPLYRAASRARRAQVGHATLSDPKPGFRDETDTASPPHHIAPLSSPLKKVLWLRPPVGRRRFASVYRRSTLATGGQRYFFNRLLTGNDRLTHTIAVVLRVARDNGSCEIIRSASTPSIGNLLQTRTLSRFCPRIFLHGMERAASMDSHESETRLGAGCFGPRWPPISGGRRSNQLLGGANAPKKTWGRPAI